MKRLESFKNPRTLFSDDIRGRDLEDCCSCVTTDTETLPVSGNVRSASPPTSCYSSDLVEATDGLDVALLP